MRCIICEIEEPPEGFADEHVFPDGIGGSLILKNVLCKPCNDMLGHKVDTGVVNHWLVSLARLVFGIKGKPGSVPNPFQNAVLAADENQKVKYYLTPDGEPDYVQYVRNIKIVPQEEGLKICMSIDESERDKIPEILKKIAERRGFYIREEQLEKLASLPSVENRPELKSSFNINAIEFNRGILKIAYELGCFWLGDKFLEDPTAFQIRAALRETGDIRQCFEKYGIKGNGSLVIKPSNYPFWDEQAPIHRAFIYKANEIIACYVRIFNILEGAFIISEQGFNYPGFESKFIELNAVERNYRTSSLIDEFSKLDGNGI